MVRTGAAGAWSRSPQRARGERPLWIRVYPEAMTDHDRVAGRREIADALFAALERRHEVLDTIVEADDRRSAVEAIAALLGISRRGSEAVMAMTLDPGIHPCRRR
ncbi:hypothetical protein MBOT_33650 [Mycobacterium botniense]|uniref:Uncharacterized protein n=1 Tax=Mycobacterium botniense TaxID=84962 RepID=A0A7I9Y1U9_9MYCO|nr:hypothetical protein MBOT_33650 [Mycobacterium botniense]